MPDIRIKVIEKRAVVEGSPVIVCGNSDYTATFTFDEEWSQVAVKTARFVYVKDGEPKHEDVVFSGNTVAVPVLSGVQFVKVGLFAGNLSTTTPARILCDLSIRCGSGALLEPTQEVYDQILAMLDEHYNATEAFIENQEATMAEYRAEWLEKVDTSILDAEQAAALCRDAVSALELELVDLDGGTPTTDAELLDDNFNGGYPT